MCFGSLKMRVSQNQIFCNISFRKVPSDFCHDPHSISPPTLLQFSYNEDCCLLADRYQRFGRNFCLNFQGLCVFTLNSITLKARIVGSS
jgi:hypothetical protein